MNDSNTLRGGADGRSIWTSVLLPLHHFFFLSSACWSSLSLSLCIFPPYMICATQAQQNLLPSQHCHKHCYIYLTLSILSFSNLQPLLPFLFRRMVDSTVFLTFFSFIITAERLKNSFFQINICYISCNFTRVLFHIQKLRNKEF